MKNFARHFLWWPNLDKSIESLTKACEACSLHFNNPPKVELNSWEYPKLPWGRLHLDFCGPIKGKYFLLALDSRTKWLEVFEIASINAKLQLSV